MELGLSGYSIAELEQQIVELETLQQELTDTLHVPTGYLQSFYNLRVHMRLVIDRLSERKRQLLALGLERDEVPPDAPKLRESGNARHRGRLLNLSQELNRRACSYRHAT